MRQGLLLHDDVPEHVAQRVVFTVELEACGCVGGAGELCGCVSLPFSSFSMDRHIIAWPFARRLSSLLQTHVHYPMEASHSFRTAGGAPTSSLGDTSGLQCALEQSNARGKETTYRAHTSFIHFDGDVLHLLDRRGRDGGELLSLDDGFGGHVCGAGLSPWFPCSFNVFPCVQAALAR